MHFVKFLMLVGERALSRCSSTTPVYPPLSLYINAEFFFWLKMVRSDNVILHTLAGCSRDSVVALLDKYCIAKLTRTVNLPCFRAVLWNVGSGCTCQAVWPSIRSIHSFIVCPICTAFITVFLIFILFLLYIFLFIVLCVFLYFIITAALCVLINYNTIDNACTCYICVKMNCVT